MSEDSPQAGGQDEATGPIDPSVGSGAAPDGASEEPRRRGFLPKKRARRERVERAKRAPEERQKKRLFGGRKSAASGDESSTEATEPSGSAGEASPKSDRPKRGFLPRRKAKTDGDVPADQPTASFAPDDGSTTPDEEPDAPKGRRRRRARRPRREKPKRTRGAKADRPPPASALRRERRALLSSRQDAVYHLGGLAFELYRRDLLQDGVLRQRAVELAALDDRIREIDKDIGERPARGRRVASVAAAPAIAGNCLVCRAEFAPEARFCSSCGARFAPEAAESEQVTGAIDLPSEP